MWRIWLGLPFVIAGISLMGMGRKWLGLEAFWSGLALAVVGLVLCLSEARARKLARDIRQGKDRPGDYGDAHYTSGSSAADSSDAGDS